MIDEHEHKLAAALAAADEALAAAKAQADAAHAAITEKAAATLQEAVDKYDATTADADRVLAGKVERAAANRARAQEQALAEFDDEMRRVYQAPDAIVVTTNAGSLELRSGRQRLGGVLQVAGDTYRVDGLPRGFIFAPSLPAARRWLWASLQPDGDVVAVA